VRRALTALAALGWFGFVLTRPWGDPAISPFSWPFGAIDVMVAHLAAVTPLAWLMAGSVRGRSNRVALALIVGAVAWSWMSGVIDPVAIRSEVEPLGISVVALTRSLAALLIVLPAMAMAWALINPSPIYRSRWGLVLSLLVAIVPPTAYAIDRADRLAGSAVESLRRRTLPSAQEALGVLAVLDPSRVVLDVPLPALRADVAAESAWTRRALANDPPSGPLAHAGLLARLERFDEAERLLAPIAASDIEALLLMASMDQARERYESSFSRYREAERAIVSGRKPESSSPAFLKRALDGQAFAAIRLRRYEEASAAYARSLAAFPSLAASTQLQMARLEAQRGRVGRAVSLAEEAMPGLDADQKAAAVAFLKQLRQETPGCLPRRPSPSPGLRSVGG
jgi:tetratricopeptide (TPR) repeat protein